MRRPCQSNEDSGIFEASQSILATSQPVLEPEKEKEKEKTIVEQTDDELFENEDRVDSPAQIRSADRVATSTPTISSNAENNYTSPATGVASGGTAPALGATTATAATAAISGATASTAATLGATASTAASSGDTASSATTSASSITTEAPSARLATSASNASQARSEEEERNPAEQANELSSANVAKEIEKCQREINNTIKALEEMRNVSFSLFFYVVIFRNQHFFFLVSYVSGKTSK